MTTLISKVWNRENKYRRSEKSCTKNFIRFDSHLKRYGTHKLCKKKECERYNKHTFVFPVWVCVHVCVCVCVLFSHIFNFRCLLFFHSFPLYFFSSSLCRFHPPFSKCWHIFYLIEFSILFKWNSMHLYYFYANRNSFDRIYRMEWNEMKWIGICKKDSFVKNYTVSNSIYVCTK